MSLTAKNFRPLTFDDYVGQDKAKNMLKIFIQAAKIKGETLDHVLLSAESGNGKTTFAQIIANEANAPLKVYSCPAIKTVDDVKDILLNVEEGDILLFDEVQSLKKKIQEVVFLAMEQFVVDTDIAGIQERVEIPHFTLIACTTELGGLELPLRNRFQIQIQLVPYTNTDMTTIVSKACKAMNIDITEQCAEIIGSASRNTPRIANSYIRRVHDVALVLNDGNITEDIIEQAFDFMDINKYGLNLTDMRYLQFLCEVHKAVGVDTIATYLGTDKISLESVVEPYLIKNQFVIKSARGRVATDKAYKVVKEMSNNE